MRLDTLTGSSDRRHRFRPQVRPRAFRSERHDRPAISMRCGVVPVQAHPAPMNGPPAAITTSVCLAAPASTSPEDRATQGSTGTR